MTTTTKKQNTTKRPGYKHTPLGWIPEEWEVKYFKELAEIDKNSLTSKTAPDYQFSYISLSDIDSEEFEINTTRQTFGTAPSRARRIVQKGDVLMSTVRPNLEGFTYIKEEVLDLIASTGFAVITPAKCDGEYLFQFLFDYQMKKQFYQLIVGSNYPAINSSDVKNLRISLPPLPEQRKIAAILSTWDDAIQQTQALIKQLEKRNKGLAQQLLTGKKRLEGFVDNWFQTEIQSIGTVIRGASPRPKGDPKYYGGNIPRLMVEDVTRDGKYVTPCVDFLTEEGSLKSRPCKKGTLTIVCSGVVGIPSFLAVDACIHDGFLAIVNINDSMAEDNFLYYQLLRMKDLMERSATHGGIFTNLTTTILREFVIPLPNLKEQQAIAAVLDKANEELKQQEQYLTTLQQQKKGLMQQLLTGAVRVKIEKE